MVRSESNGYLKQEVDFDSQTNDVGILETKKSPAKARQDECRDDESTLLEVSTCDLAHHMTYLSGLAGTRSI